MVNQTEVFLLWLEHQSKTPHGSCRYAFFRVPSDICILPCGCRRDPYSARFLVECEGEGNYRHMQCSHSNCAIRFSVREDDKNGARKDNPNIIALRWPANAA